MNYVDTIDRIRHLAKGEDCCNDELCEHLLNRGCYYLLSKSKMYFNKQMIPVAYNSFVTKRRYQLCKNILEKFNNIPYAIIKGAALSSRIYGNPAYRVTGDIDILVPMEYSNIVKSILHSEGLIQGMDKIKLRLKKALLCMR